MHRTLMFNVKHDRLVRGFYVEPRVGLVRQARSDIRQKQTMKTSEQPFKCDAQGVYGLVEQLETSWNSGDSAGFAAAFADDADFVDILGRHHQGRIAIEAGHRRIFDTLYRGSRNTYRIERIRFVTPDLAVAFLRSDLVSRLGERVDDPDRQVIDRTDRALSKASTRQTLVFSKETGAWEIITFQNTKIAKATQDRAAWEKVRAV